MNKTLFNKRGSRDKFYSLLVVLLFLYFFMPISDLYAGLGENKTNNVIVQQQKKQITGKVVDNNNTSIIGANIIEAGTSNGTITDMDGNFSLNVAANAILHVSYIGYLEQEIETEGRTHLNIILKEDTKALDEVIVVGYGTMKKSDLTGAVSSVKTSDIQQTPMTSIDQGLVGRASGVQVIQTSGMPGAVASIRVRGSSSLQAGNEPLYVIDGFPVYSGDGFGQTGGNAQISGLSSINPSDIESIEILKDAAATAIYGARAANGVVLITTKSGKKGQDLISIEANYGIQQVAKKIDVMNAQEYAVLVNEAYTNDGLAPWYNEQRMAEIVSMGKGTDWQDLVFRRAITQNYLLNFSGGDEKTTYSISGNYLNQEGVIINSDFERFSLRLNLDRKIKNNFKVGAHINTSHTITNAVATDSEGNSTGVVNGALKMNPIQTIYENEETKEYTQANSPGVIIANPYATAKEQLFKNGQSRLLGDMYIEWEFIPNLLFRTSVGTDVIYFKGNRYTPSTIYQANGLATGNINVNRSINWLNENTLTWTRTLDNHSFNLLGGFTLQQNNSEGVSASSSAFVNDVLTYNDLGSGSVYNSPGSSATQWNMISYLGRINYSYRDRYLFSANARFDGSSRFGENNKYGFFPSASAGWRISEESFMEPLRSIISNLKLRASYGFTGNTEIGLYESLPTLGSVDWIIGNQLVTGFFPNKIPNPDLKWERTGQFDLGVDIGLIDNRIRITSDLYRKKTTDLLYNVAIPSASGFETMLKNIGSVENKGLELSIESDNFVNEFVWNTNFNIAFNRNKVLELGGEPYKEIGGGDILKTGSFRRLIVGEPIGVFYGYKFDGIFQSEEEVQKLTTQPSPLGVGYRRYKDLNGDGAVDSSNDRMILGDSNSDFFGGLTNNLSYKGLELNIFFQYSYGNEIFNFNAIELETPTGGNNVFRELLNRWTPTNPSQTYPKATTNRAALVSDRWVEDGSYLKLKTVSLSYSFPELKSNFFRSMRLYLTGQNLITWTSYRGYDPEVSFRGASTLQGGEDFGGYPQARTFMMGIQLNIK